MASPHLRKIDRTAPDVAKRVRQRLRSVFDYAVEVGLIVGNPLPAPRRHKPTGDRAHLPATLATDGVGAILRAADKAEVGKGVRRAHYLATFTAQRIGEIVPASWDEVDLQSATWSIPRDRMKRKDAERGPPRRTDPSTLPSDDEGMESHGRRRCRLGLLFTPRRAHITREAVEKFYRRTLDLSRKHSPHSWRSVLSTWANDAGEDAAAVEAQLDHAPGGKVKAAYDRQEVATSCRADGVARGGADRCAQRREGSPVGSTQGGVVAPAAREPGL